jgi:hypothetical protein
MLFHLIQLTLRKKAVLSGLSRILPDAFMARLNPCPSIQDLCTFDLLRYEAHFSTAITEAVGLAIGLGW